MYICPIHDPFDKMDKNLIIWMHFHLYLWHMSLVASFLLEPLFCQHTYLMLPLKTMDHSPKLPHLQQSEYLLRMDMALLFHLFLVCPGSLDNTTHIISGVSRASAWFESWPCFDFPSVRCYDTVWIAIFLILHFYI